MKVFARAAMMIRKPVNDVFNAFTDAEAITKFWFSKSTGNLQPGAKVQWTWESYNLTTGAEVKEFEQNKRILICWTGGGDPTLVEWLFKDRGNGTTFVTIVHSGAELEGEKLLESAIGTTEGWAWVLAGAKAYLEQGVELNLIWDRFPDGF